MNDVELVAQLQRFEPEAVDVLMSRFADRLYNYAYYHSSDHHLAEDIVSETLTRIVEKIGDYQQREVPFKAWVFRIARNLLADHYRHRSRHPSVSLEAASDESSSLYETLSSDYGGADGGELATQVAQREDLRQALNLLPEDQRTVFILRFIEGNDLEQVVTILNKSIASIKSLQFRATRNLRQILDDNNCGKKRRVGYE
ncbi:MAG: RNA polymerase sigma factor [Chloroflexi bacterium]|uniref:RNA polymerase sigma factor n=1 Tax=Candidatus Chlorohelix allophototropha TaxID=3003348 RepID=A0A8T7M1M2_9CHLR|nr:RNA polymerase sigma factor [Chloroflexota bacterium]WJW67821.1 RNA polymerase sigma factor [Chloroflexota bacterium L227-S17]